MQRLLGPQRSCPETPRGRPKAMNGAWEDVSGGLSRPKKLFGEPGRPFSRPSRLFPCAFWAREASLGLCCCWMGEDEAELRRKTVRALARNPRHASEKGGCSPSVFLTMGGLAICFVALSIGVACFNVQRRRYGAFGGYLEWQCSLVKCRLRYSYPGSHPRAALRMKRYVVPMARRVLQKRRVDEAEAWMETFARGRPEDFGPLFELPLCLRRGFQAWLFKGFCETSSWSGKFVGGTVWSIVKRASRWGLALVLGSILMTGGVFLFVAIDHQAFRRPEDKKQRWAVSEVKTGKFRPVAKVAAGLSPLFTAICVMEYRLSIQNFERVGGVLGQTTLGSFAGDVGEFQMPWGCVWYLLVALVQLAVAIALLRGPLRKPELPLALDVVDITLERRSRMEPTLEMTPLPRAPQAPHLSPRLSPRLAHPAPRPPMMWAPRPPWAPPVQHRFAPPRPYWGPAF